MVGNASQMKLLSLREQSSLAYVHLFCMNSLVQQRVGFGNASQRVECQVNAMAKKSSSADDLVR